MIYVPDRLDFEIRKEALNCALIHVRDNGGVVLRVAGEFYKFLANKPAT